MRTASSSVSNGTIASTGPKISSRRMSLPGCTSDTTVGSKNVPGPSTGEPPVVTVAPRSTASPTRLLALSTARSSMRGPICTPSSVPRPIFMACTRSVTRRVNSSTTLRCTMKRFAAVHACPMLRNFASIAPSTALSRSASSNTTNGALPPSSIEVRSTPGAACCSSFTPTGVDPVNESLRSRGSEMMRSETAPVFVVVTTFTTPAGTPASCRIWAKNSVVSGVSVAGLMTTVQPAASAGAILRVAIASGKFHGVIR